MSSEPASSWPTWRSSHQQRAAQPEPSSSASTNDRGPIPAAPKTLLQLGGVRQRMPTAVSRHRAVPRGRSRCRDERRRGGARRLRITQAHVDEDDAHSAPRGVTSRRSTGWSGKRSAELAGAARAGSAPSDTVGPEPDSVAPEHSHPGRCARMASSRGSKGGTARAAGHPAPPRRASHPARRPRAEKRRPPGARSGLECGTVAGSVAGLGRRPLVRDHRHGRKRQRLGDPRDPSVPGEHEPAEQRRGEVVRVGSSFSPTARSSSARGLGSRGGEPERDRRGRRAEPALERIRLTNANLFPEGSARSAYARTARFVSSAASSDAPSPSTTTPSPSVTSSSFQRSSATAAHVEARHRCSPTSRGRGPSCQRAAAAIASGSASTCRAPARTGRRCRCP